MARGVWGVGLPPQNPPLRTQEGRRVKGNHRSLGMGPYYMI
jgi:hypothetical protein